jgi:hypothetical protein
VAAVNLALRISPDLTGTSPEIEPEIDFDDRDLRAIIYTFGQLLILTPERWADAIAISACGQRGPWRSEFSVA